MTGRLSGLALTLFLAFASSANAAPTYADLVILHADVHTMEDAAPRATAVAAQDGRIVAVGDDAGVRPMIGPRTRVIDAGGRVVLPGFIDTHMHPRALFDELGPYGDLDLTPEGGVISREALFAKLRAKAAVTPPGQTITGRGYNDNLVGGHPTARELDAVTPGHPVILRHSSGHRALVNTLALTGAGITAATKDPAGGRLVRGPDGEATGIVLESASGLFSRLRDTVPKPDRAAVIAAYRKQFDAFMAQGLTSIAVAGTSPDELEVFRALLQSGMPVQIYAMIRNDRVDWLLDNRNKPEWQVSGLTLRSVKMFHGNSLSGRTAWLYEPYEHDHSYYGLPPRMSQPELNAAVQKAHDAGLQIAVHSNGDREIDMTLTALEAAQTRNPRADPRHRIEHASVVNAGILARVKQDGVALAPHSYIINHGEKMEEFGAARWPWMHPNKRALALGIPIGGNSDYPVSPAMPLERIQSLVTMRARSSGKIYGEGQQLTVEQAVRAWTLGSATLQFEEGEKGSLKPGKRADLVILSGDPWATDPEEIETIKVDATVIDGAVVFERRRQRTPDLTQRATPQTIYPASRRPPCPLSPPNRRHATPW
jgi:predicted amidohydrolase YtcJ